MYDIESAFLQLFVVGVIGALVPFAAWAVFVNLVRT